MKRRTNDGLLTLPVAALKIAQPFIASRLRDGQRPDGFAQRLIDLALRLKNVLWFHSHYGSRLAAG
jgi:hypothetical protein